MPVSTRKRSYLTTSDIDDIISSKEMKAELKQEDKLRIKKEIKEEYTADDYKPDEIRIKLESTPVAVSILMLGFVNMFLPLRIWNGQ